MIPWLLLICSLALLILGTLTVVRAPAWSPWKLAVLAGEFGHWLALLAVAVAFGAPLAPGEGSDLAPVSAGAALLAAGLFLKPAWQAWRLGARLPDLLQAQFGATLPARPAFSCRELYLGRDPEPVTPQTFDVAPGLPLDFYPPAKRSDGGLAPCAMIIHGGGWDSGDRTQLPQLNHWLAARGYAVAALSYRLAPQHQWPAPRADVQAALAALKTRAGELGIDPSRFCLIGRSAGGQIAQCVAYTENDPAIRGVATLYAPSDLIFGYVNTHENDMLKSPALMRQYLGGTPESARANFESASSIFHVTAHAPPTLLLHGINDALSWHRHSDRLAARLASLGVPHLYVALPWATHAFDYNLHGPGGQLTTYALEMFLAGVTRRSDRG